MKSKNQSSESFGGALALLIRVDNNDRVTGGQLIRRAEDARGHLATAVVWLREPTAEERAIVVPMLVIVPGVELRAY